MQIFDGCEQDIEVKRFAQTQKIPLLNFLVMSFKVGGGDDSGNAFESNNGVEVIVESKPRG